MKTLSPAAEFDYSPRVRELFVDLQHAGSLVGATHASPSGDLELQGDACITPAVVSAQAGSHEQGARVHLQVEIIDGRVQAVRYQAYGCPHFLAACESLSRWLEGRSLSEAGAWSRADLERELALPAQKRARLLVLEEALGELQTRAAARPTT